MRRNRERSASAARTTRRRSVGAPPAMGVRCRSRRARDAPNGGVVRGRGMRAAVRGRQIRIRTSTSTPDPRTSPGVPVPHHRPFAHCGPRAGDPQNMQLVGSLGHWRRKSSPAASSGRRPYRRCSFPPRAPTTPRLGATAFLCPSAVSPRPTRRSDQVRPPAEGAARVRACAAGQRHGRRPGRVQRVGPPRARPSSARSAAPIRHRGGRRRPRRRRGREGPVLGGAARRGPLRLDPWAVSVLAADARHLLLVGAHVAPPR